MSEGPEFRVSKPIQSATKAVVATVTTGLGALTVFATAIGDGSIGSGEVGNLVTVLITAGATIAGVWAARNKEL